MIVHKFGGASISTVDRFQQVGQIALAHIDTPCLLVISALGKTTNGLEKVVDAFWEGRKEEALSLFGIIRNQHLQFVKYLMHRQHAACENQLQSFFTEAEWILHDKPVRSYNYYYDQLVAIGELMSSTLVSFYLKEIGWENTWMDVRDLLKTDENHREAGVDWPMTRLQTQTLLAPLMNQGKRVVTQGFIGCTAENDTTTLGREGSDYSAAIFAHLLDAQAQVIWKDVPAVMNADPRLFPDAQPIPVLSYDEVIEMAYYGAQVIHPKTIKPLFEKKIPLLVRCFLDASLPGTQIGILKPAHLPPIFVKKENQVLVSFQSKDYSFVGEHTVGLLFQLFEREKMRPNLTQHGAIGFMALFDDQQEKLMHMATQAETWLNVMVQRGLSLSTVRHYNPEAISRMTEGRVPLVVQQTSQTWQAVF